jgi:hypothetical protein
MEGQSLRCIESQNLAEKARLPTLFFLNVKP